MKRFFLFVAFVSVCLPTMASAHLGTYFFEKRVGDLLVDIGYDIPFMQGEETLIDFSLVKMKDNFPEGLESFDNIQWKIYSGSTILDSKSTDKPEFGKVFATVTPDRSGNWKLSTTFNNAGTTVASAEFDMTIQKGSLFLSKQEMEDAVFALFIVLIAATTFVYLRYRQ